MKQKFSSFDFSSVLFSILYFVLFIYYLFTPLQISASTGNSAEEDSLTTIHVVSHGWHTGIILHSRDLPDSIKSQPNFPNATYIEFGWGDKAYYMHPDPGFWTAAKAAMLPTSSVMHVVGFDLEVARYFRASQKTDLEIDRVSRDGILESILAGFKRDRDGNIIPLGRGLYGQSQFYDSDHTYIFPKTCNVWTAACLKAGGFKLNPLRYQRAETLMKKIEKITNKNHRGEQKSD